MDFGGFWFYGRLTAKIDFFEKFLLILAQGTIVGTGNEGSPKNLRIGPIFGFIPPTPSKTEVVFFCLAGKQIGKK